MLGSQCEFLLPLVFTLHAGSKTYLPLKGSHVEDTDEDVASRWDGHQRNAFNTSLPPPYIPMECSALYLDTDQVASVWSFDFTINDNTSTKDKPYMSKCVHCCSTKWSECNMLVMTLANYFIIVPPSKYTCKRKQHTTALLSASFSQHLKSCTFGKDSQTLQKVSNAVINNSHVPHRYCLAWDYYSEYNIRENE